MTWNDGRPEHTAEDAQSFKALLRRALWALAIGGLSMTLCYFAVDRPVAFFVHDQGLNRFTILRWLTYIPEAFDAVAPLILVLAAVKLAGRPLTRLEWTLVAASTSLMVGLCFEYYLKFLFGRYWPETWIDNNPSLIGDNAYGFHPFHFGPAYGSFPSGHAARVFAVLSVVGLTYPGWRWVCAIIEALVITGLLGMDYHFVGDIIGGAILGTIIGAYAARMFSLRPSCIACSAHGLRGPSETEM